MADRLPTSPRWSGALARVQQDLGRLTLYSELRLRCMPCWLRWTVSSRDPLPDPYWRLQNDGDFWEVSDDGGRLADPYPGADPPGMGVLRRSNAGFTLEVYELLLSADVLLAAAGLVARTYFPGDEQKVLQSAGLTGVRVAQERVWWVNQGATVTARSVPGSRVGTAEGKVG